MLLPRTWAILSSVFSETGDEYVRIRLVEYLRIFFFSPEIPLSFHEYLLKVFHGPGQCCCQYCQRP